MFEHDRDGRLGYLPTISPLGPPDKLARVGCA